MEIIIQNILEVNTHAKYVRVYLRGRAGFVRFLIIHSMLIVSDATVVTTTTTKIEDKKMKLDVVNLCADGLVNTVSIGQDLSIF